MKQRIISAIVGVILLAAVMISNNRYIFDAAVVLISTVAVYEVISAVGLKKSKVMCTIALIMPLVLMIVWHLNSSREYITPVIFLFLAIFLLVMLFGHKRYNFNDVMKFFTISVMISLSFIHISYVRAMAYGSLSVFIIFIGSWITDTCAYFTGVAIGKHKLAPSISPKKTVEGSIGGIVGVTVIITAYTVVCSNIFKMQINLFPVICVGLLCGILSQLGDLCASIIKRENNIKDFGNIMPGHGGVMDRFDSFLFVAPAVYYVLEYFPIFLDKSM